MAIFGCDIIVLDDKEDTSDAEELTEDLMALLASLVVSIMVEEVLKEDMER